MRYLTRIYTKCITLFTIAFLCLLASGMAGIYHGYKLGIDAVCEDVAFYYNNDLPLKACVTKGVK